MLEIFANPLNMVVGGALISSPIIIHLINRMRFKRVRWAAMEFLLKSQKRNRRRLIIEQLLLLALRILLVLLLGLLLGRFLWAAGLFRPRNTMHVVILDDRLSMGDHWKGEDGARKSCFEVGKQLVEREIAQKAVQARSAQRLVVRRLSNLSADLFDAKRLNDDAVRDLGNVLGRVGEPSALHLHLADGVKLARDLFGQKENAEDEHVLHLVSDFRNGQWTEPELTSLHEALAGLKGVKVNLIDTAHPWRAENQREPKYHDNLAVLELRPETRIVAEGIPVQFTVRVANYGQAGRKNVRVTVRVDGTERPEGSLTIEDLAGGGQPVEKTFLINFVLPPGHKAGDPYFAVVTTGLENEEAGLQADNLRYATVEVRRSVPVLLVDGDPANGEKPGGDTYHLRALFTSARGYEVVRGGVAELRRPDLERYPSIYLLNVPRLDEVAQANLERYVRGGGSVCFFLGDRVEAGFYNQKLYAGGTGVFPVPLADQPTPPVTEQQKQQRVLDNLLNAQPQIFVRDPAHPATAELYKVRNVLKLPSIDRHYPVPRQRWDREQRERHHVEELATLPNERPVVDYEAEARDIAEALPVDDPAFAAYRPGLELYRRAVREALGGKSLAVLGGTLEALLNDPGDPQNLDRPSMKQFWQQTDPRVQELRARVDQFRERVQLGDPLVVAGRYGQGRTVVFTTTAGQKWNSWAGGSEDRVSFPVLMVDLQKYLTSLEGEPDRTVGSALELRVDAPRYQKEMGRALLQERDQGAAAPPAPAESDTPAWRAAERSLGRQSGAEEGGQLAFRFDEARQPGVYLFDLYPKPEAGLEPKRETRAYAFNVDALNESDLKRAAKAELDRVGLVRAPGDVIVEPNRRSDLSESAWFYLLFLVVLVAEQALAVHLSFHLRGAEGQLPPQAVTSRQAA